MTVGGWSLVLGGTVEDSVQYKHQNYPKTRVREVKSLYANSQESWVEVLLQGMSSLALLTSCAETIYSFSNLENDFRSNESRKAPCGPF